MKRQFSLKWLIALSFLTLTVVLVIGYSLLSVQFFIRGMDNIIASNMAKVVDSYMNSVPVPQREELNNFSGYSIGKHWEQMPENIRQAFIEPKQSGAILKYDDSGWFRRPDEIHFAMRVMLNGETYFISHTVSRETASLLGGRNAAQSMKMLLTISLITLLILAAITILLLRRIERPVKALGQWAKGLDENKLNETPPNFSYPELNELANLIRTSLSSVQKSLEREHRFLRHSSHELRTPISVILTNIELLYKLQESSHTVENPRQKQIIERINRASRTMKYLTETLLWLSRDSEENPPVKQINLEQLLQELIVEMRYLLRDKAVELIVETTPFTVTAAEIPARIVLGNLIRNAFQHTWHGVIRITQKEGEVEIVNDIAETDGAPQDSGFGLGLQLTEQLTRKLNWPYISSSESNKHNAKVSIG